MRCRTEKYNSKLEEKTEMSKWKLEHLLFELGFLFYCFFVLHQLFFFFLYSLLFFFYVSLSLHVQRKSGQASVTGRPVVLPAVERRKFDLRSSLAIVLKLKLTTTATTE